MLCSSQWLHLLDILCVVFSDALCGEKENEKWKVSSSLLPPKCISIDAVDLNERF